MAIYTTNVVYKFLSVNAIAVKRAAGMRCDRFRRSDVTVPYYYWLNDIFEEPYTREYAGDSVDANMGAAGFEAVQIQDVWWIHQLTSRVKPIPSKDVTVQKNFQLNTPTSRDTTIDNNDLEGLGSPAFGVTA